MGNIRVALAQLGARKHYQEPVLFQRLGILERFYTDFYSGHSYPINLLRKKAIYPQLPNVVKKALDRYDPILKNASIIHFPQFAYQYLQALKNASPAEASKIFIWGGEEFCRLIIKYGLGKANTIYGFNSACLELFEYAKKQDIRCILDQTLVDYSLVYKLLQEEEELWSQWSLTPFTVNEYDLKLQRREHQEQDLADAIICGSDFVKDSLTARGVDANKITVVSLGRVKQETQKAPQDFYERPQKTKDGLKILFVGSVNLRKGIPYLLEALKKLKGEIPFICKVVGSIEIKPERIAEYQDVCEFLGRIPRSQVKDLYAWADVFVLPSICEGSAMVTYEAMSSGVPVITTYNSGSIVRDGIDGVIVPIRDVEAITNNLLKIYQGDSNFAKTSNTVSYIDDIFRKAETTLKEVVII